jgi:polyisoprenoid-binding protein YceI
MRKGLLLFCSVLAFSLLSFIAPPITWTFDKSHSKLGFSITHLMVSDVDGALREVESTITASNEDLSDAVVTVKADINSIDTGNPDRDAHLKSPDFFDAAKYPTLNFKSSSFKKTSDNKYTVVGDLTLHGITKSVTLEAAARRGTNPMSKKEIVGFKVTGTIKRSDFGISPSTPAAMLSDEVSIVVNSEFSKN